jgi:hypothetical protein
MAESDEEKDDQRSRSRSDKSKSKSKNTTEYGDQNLGFTSEPQLLSYQPSEKMNSDYKAQI